MFALLVCGSVFGIAGWRALHAHDLELREGRVTTANLARSMAAHAQTVVQDADIVLAGLAERLQVEGTSEVALARLHRLLVMRVAAIPTLHHLVVFSAAGDALTTSFAPMPAVNVADRPYFMFHRDHSTVTPLVGPPIQNRADGRWSLPVSRRVDKADGTFGGVVVAIIDCETFSRFYSKFDVGEHGTVILLHKTNVPVARHPPPSDPNFRNKPSTQDPWDRGPTGNGRLVSVLDGVARVYSYQRVDQLPLLVIVALSERDLLEVWRRDTWITMAACSAVSAMLCLLGWRLAGQIRQQGEREIIVRRSEEQYRLLADHSTDVIIHLGPDRRQRYVSPASKHLFGYSPEELLNGYLHQIISPEDLPPLEESIGKIFRTGRAPPIVHRVRKKDGSHVWVETQGQALNEEQGVIISIRDATFRKEAKDSLRDSNKRLSLSNTELERLARRLTEARDAADLANQAKSRFLAGMSHELRTPLNGVLGYAHLLRAEPGLTPLQAGRVDAMMNAGAHLLQMINQVLDLSEVEAGHAKVRLSEIDPREVARACLDVVRPPAEAKGITLDFVALTEAPPRVTTDPTRLRQVLLNLLGNAVKFTAQGAVLLRLRAAPDRTGVRFEVVDTGPGISASNRDRLFQEFERLGANEGGFVEGSGLGLALAARLASTMGGRLGHEDNPTGGSVFWIELPLIASTVERSSEATMVPDMPGAKPALARSMRVLVVDDVAMNRDIAAAFLRAAGHAVVCAENGTEAVAVAGTTDFDVVLMDVRMPGIDGLEATRRIRALAGPRARVPVVALTAQAFTEQIKDCLQAGMDSHLSKPFDPETLLSAVTQAAQAGKARCEANAVPLEASKDDGYEACVREA